MVNDFNKIHCGGWAQEILPDMDDVDSVRVIVKTADGSRVTYRVTKLPIEDQSGFTDEDKKRSSE